MAVCREISNLLQPSTDRFVAPIFLRCAAAPPGWRKQMIQTPGAVQTSQLIHQQAIGAQRLSVTVGRAKQSTAPSAPACCAENKGGGGRRGMGLKGGWVGGWVVGGGVAHGITARKKKTHWA